jgi:cyanamide hydratase
MSFEFKGAIVARDLILQLGGVEDQADSICDAIVRHQDIFVKGYSFPISVDTTSDSTCSTSGNITQLGQTLQLATILGTRSHTLLRFSLLTSFPDNVGMCAPSILTYVPRCSLRILFSRANLIHAKLIETTVAEHPRLGWSEHFASVIEKELSLKPWCHSSTFEIPGWKRGTSSNFATDVRGNDVMRPFD